MMQVDKEYYENLTREKRRRDPRRSSRRADQRHAQADRLPHAARTAKPDGWTLAAYERELRRLPGRAKRVLTTMTREQVVDEAKKANIRGRGGAGFPMGVKWSFMPKPHGAEARTTSSSTPTRASPGTHKDRTLMEENPHACVEGCIIGCYGIGAHVAYIYVRDELHLSKARLEGAIKEARAKGYLGKTPVREGLRRRGLRPHRRRRVHLRRGDLAAQLARGPARRAAPQAPLPRASRRVRLPDHGEQPRDHRRRARRRSAWAARSSASSRALHDMNDGGVRLYGVNGHVKKPRRLRARGRPHASRAHLRRRRRRRSATRASSASSPAARRRPCCAPRRRVNAPDEKSPLHPWHGKSVLRRAARRRHDARVRHDARHLLRDGHRRGDRPGAGACRT